MVVQVVDWRKDAISVVVKSILAEEVFRSFPFKDLAGYPRGMTVSISAHPVENGPQMQGY